MDQALFQYTEAIKWH